MFLISTGKRTVLSDFIDLNTRAVYEHTNGESTDFQCYRKKSIFVEINKKCGNVEILRVKEKEQKVEIQRVRKLNVENVYSVACTKTSLEEMALGLTNGQVKLYNYKNLEFVHHFKADNMRASVLFMDYNYSDEYISSVFENGQINIYGIKTKAKIDTINIDQSTTLARFHPMKKFQLSIASYNGAVTIFDIQTKKPIYHLNDAHVAPCSDLCMSACLPDMLLSVGYDCAINIFDTRQKNRPKTLTYCHPLSTVAVSDCGKFFCVGNLKGELITIDMRNTDVYLECKRVHQCAVSRIAFMPMTEIDMTAGLSFGSSESATAASMSAAEQLDKHAELISIRKSVGTSSRKRDSFCDFLDFQANRGNEKMSARFAPRRDSFDWDTLQRKPHMNTMDRHHASSGASSANNSGAGGESFDDKHTSYDLTRSKGFSSTLRDRNSTSTARPHRLGGEKLMEITEEQCNKKDQTSNSSNSSDKENPANDLELSHRLNMLQTAGNSSTPHRDGAANPDKVDHAEKDVENNNASNPVANTDEIMKELAALRSDMEQRFSLLESNVKINAETNKWHIYTQSFNLWDKQYQLCEDMHFALSVLLRSDAVMAEVSRLQDENDMLKLKLREAKRNNN